MSTTPPNRLPLDALHRDLGAKMGPFAGFEMPIQYQQGLKAEHLHTRQSAGLFDVSHMGQLRIRPRDGRLSTLTEQLEAALPIDFSGWPPGRQRYTVRLNESGGIEDDLMVIYLQDEVRLIVNASNRERGIADLGARCPGLHFEWVEAALLALQGPQAATVLSTLDPSCATMRFMEARTLQLLGASCLATRSGYTGEDGWELSIPLEQAESVVRALLAHPAAQLVGLGARDTLRLEAGLPLHGHDIRPDISPIEAGLVWAIGPTRRPGGSKAGGFPGAATVLAHCTQGAPRTLVGLRSTQTIPIRAHAPIVDLNDQPVGEVTSGTVSPTLGCPIMLALLATPATSTATGLRAVVRDQHPPVHIVPLPFVPKRYQRTPMG
jgi:aminomethyltransferase